MTLDILLQFQKDPASTKFLIMKLLIAHPLSKNSEIQKYLKKYFNRKISFQAVKQALGELVEENVLCCENKKYFISQKWIVNLKEFLMFADEGNYTAQFKFLLDDSTRHITLQNLEELGYFIFYNLDKYVKENEELVFYINNLWIPFGSIEIRNRLSILLHRAKSEVYVKGNTLGDKILSYWYKKRGKVVLHHKYSSEFQYIIFNDLVIQIYMGSQLLEQFKTAYSLNLKSYKNVFQNIINLTTIENQIEVTMIKSESLANELKNKIRNK